MNKLSTRFFRVFLRDPAAHCRLVRRAIPLLALPVLIGICGCRQAQPPEDLSRYPSGTEAKEAPMLAHLVAQGKLPPLEERLPDHPLVAQHDYDGYEGPGVYGGTWYGFHPDTWLGAWIMTLGYDPLIRWRFDCQGLEPGLAESWDFNEDGTVLTLHLRKGLRWSDGHPYTAEDFLFWYDLKNDSRVGQRAPSWCMVKDAEGVNRPMVVEAPDAHTLVLRFAAPGWLIPLFLANGTNTCGDYIIPKHYMSQFHPDHNPEYNDFITFGRMNGAIQNPERPVLWPWRPVSTEKGGFRVRFERNPYYYVVDDFGRQLPYIDQIKTTFVASPQVQVLQMLSGDVDCEFRALDLRDLDLYKMGEESGNYRIRMWQTGTGAEPGLIVNWSPPDPVLRALVRDQRFRKALALGIDRDKINTVVFKGFCVPQGATTSRESWHFADEEGQALFHEWEQADVEFDLAKANALLDEMGLTEKDESGIRLRPDGERLRIIMDFRSDIPFYADAAVIVREGWQKLGIDAVVFTPQFAELDLRQMTGEFTISTNAVAEMDVFTYPSWIFPVTNEYWHPLTGLDFLTQGKEGEPPTGSIKELTDLYVKITKEKDLAKRHALVREAVHIHIKDGPFTLGTVGRRPNPILVSNRFHNVPNNGITGPWAIAHPATSYPEQYFIREGAL